MANVQLEDGYIKIANRLYQALYKVDLSGSELRIIHFILYQTYGYNRKTRQLSANYIAQGTNIPIKTVRRCLKQLVYDKFITSRGSASGTKSYGINKNYDKWVLKNGEGVLKFEKGLPKNEYPLPKNEQGDYSKVSRGVLKNEQRGTQKWAQGYSKMSTNTIQNKTIQNKTIQSSSTTTGTATPKIEEIVSYCRENNYSFDCNKFYCHYNSLGWKYKGQPITDWKSLADRWNATEKQSEEPKASYDIEKYESFSIFDD